MITRDEILSRLEQRLKHNDKVNAMWLEGADGTGSTDVYSDIDIVLDVEDGFADEIFSLLENVLTEIGSLDLCYEEPRNNAQTRYKVYHLENTPDTLFLDVTVQGSSRNYRFTRENESEVPQIIFDKNGTVQFQNINLPELHRELHNRLYHLENMVKQKARALKYVKRNKFIEAMGYYQKFVVTPLIELLRIKYRPINHGYYIVSISKHLPAEVVSSLEELFKIHSINDLGMKIEQAAGWFHTVLIEVRNRLEGFNK